MPGAPGGRIGAVVLSALSCAPNEPGIGPDPFVRNLADIPPPSWQELRPSPAADGAGGAGPTGNAVDAGSPSAVPAPDSGREASQPDPVETPMTFFVTSAGLGSGGDLGGLAGADAHCRRLARLASAGARDWRALLCTDSVDGRSRIGQGPWHNHAGILLASNVGSLFSDGIRFGAFRLQVMLDEYGEPVPGSSHDIVTGCGEEGYRVIGGNCNGWTSNADFDAAVVGHSDNGGSQGGSQDHGWVSAHVTGCTQGSLTLDGGDGRLYCFAADTP